MVSKSTIELEKIGYTCTIVWAMLFVFNLWFYVWFRTLSSLFLAGVMLGGTIIYLLTLPHMNWQNRFIDKLFKNWDDSTNEIHKSIQEKIKLLKMPKRNKKLAKGR